METNLTENGRKTAKKIFFDTFSFATVTFLAESLRNLFKNAPEMMTNVLIPKTYHICHLCGLRVGTYGQTNRQTDRHEDGEFYILDNFLLALKKQQQNSSR